MYYHQQENTIMQIHKVKKVKFNQSIPGGKTKSRECGSHPSGFSRNIR